MNEPKGEQVKRLETIANVVSPLALGAALLYYFGWVRTTIQARALGYDASLSGLTTQDYVLKSINVLYVPLILLMVVAVGFGLVHRAAIAVALASQPFKRFVLVLAVFASLAWIVLIPLAFATTLSSVPGNTYAVPLAIVVGMLGVLYGDSVRKRLSSRRVLGTQIMVLVIVLLLLGLFWSVERFARTMGEAFAADIIARPQQLTSVSVLSGRDLGINDGCVRETSLSSGGEYAFRYDGLRLLQVTEGQYYLISICDGTPRVLVLGADDDNIRLEFTPGALH